MLQIWSETCHLVLIQKVSYLQSIKPFCNCRGILEITKPKDAMGLVHNGPKDTMGKFDDGGFMTYSIKKQRYETWKKPEKKKGLA